MSERNVHDFIVPTTYMYVNVKGEGGLDVKRPFRSWKRGEGRNPQFPWYTSIVIPFLLKVPYAILTRTHNWNSFSWYNGYWTLLYCCTLVYSYFKKVQNIMGNYRFKFLSLFHQILQNFWIELIELISPIFFTILIHK